jgi:hypothetical protein
MKKLAQIISFVVELIKDRFKRRKKSIWNL